MGRGRRDRPGRAPPVRRAQGRAEHDQPAGRLRRRRPGPRRAHRRGRPRRRRAALQPRLRRRRAGVRRSALEPGRLRHRRERHALPGHLVGATAVRRRAGVGADGQELDGGHRPARCPHRVRRTRGHLSGRRVEPRRTSSTGRRRRRASRSTTPCRRGAAEDANEPQVAIFEVDPARQTGQFEVRTELTGSTEVTTGKKGNRETTTETFEAAGRAGRIRLIHSGTRYRGVLTSELALSP